MTCYELDVIMYMDDAWLAFFNVLKSSGLDIHKIEQAMGNKDCFNDVEDAIMAALGNEIEGEE